MSVFIYTGKRYDTTKSTPASTFGAFDCTTSGATCRSVMIMIANTQSGRTPFTNQCANVHATWSEDTHMCKRPNVPFEITP